MNTWLLISIVLLGLIGFLFFIVWADWKHKCRKTIKQNKLDCFLKGYAMLKEDNKKPTLLLLSGLLGVNSSELVFGHRFQDSVLNIKKDLSDVDCIEVHEYNENDFIALLHEHYEFQEGKIKYAIINMAGLTTTKRIPKLLKTCRICKIKLKNDSDMYFYYKYSPKAEETLKKIQKYICSNMRL